MGYRERLDLGEYDAQTIAQARRTQVWLLPILVFQQASLIFRESGSPLTHYLGIACWALVVLVEIAILSGWKFRWISARDHAVLNDEWHQAVSGDSCRWGLAATAVTGIGLVAADRWIELPFAQTIFVLVNAAMLVAGLRYAWLNRGSADDDE